MKGTRSRAHPIQQLQFCKHYIIVFQIRHRPAKQKSFEKGQFSRSLASVALISLFLFISAIQACCHLSYVWRYVTKPKWLLVGMVHIYFNFTRRVMVYLDLKLTWKVLWLCDGKMVSPTSPTTSIAPDNMNSHSPGWKSPLGGKCSR